MRADVRGRTGCHGPWHASTARGVLGTTDLGLAAQQEDSGSLLATSVDTYRRVAALWRWRATRWLDLSDDEACLHANHRRTVRPGEADVEPDHGRAIPLHPQHGIPRGAMVYAGVASLANALWALPLLPVTLLVMQRTAIEREERYLERKFGEEYLRYKAQVRRWI